MQNPFSSITTAGLLLPLDLLTRVGSMDRALPGMTPADYHVPGSIRLNEAATAAYSRALAYWKSFRKKFDALPASDTGTTLTRDEWLLPLFDCLGYGRLQNKRTITIDSKDYPISHGWEDHVPIHLLSARLPLDKRTQNVSGAATRSPYSLVQELLNRSSKHHWGFVSNGLKLYVLRDNASLTRSANVEFDLESMMDGEYHADFTVLFLICHQSRLEIQPTPIVDNKSSNKKAAKPAKAKKSASKVAEKLGKYELDLDDEASEESELDGDEEAIEIEEPTRLGPENCWLEAWTKLAGEQGTRAKERLRDGVQLAIQTFGAGFYTCSSNAELHQRLRSGELSTQDYYRQLLRLVYRLLMLMVAEDKRTESGQNLLHPIETPAHIRDRYNQFYSVGRIRKLANERRGTPHRDLYESLKTTFLKLRDGYAPLGIPGIGSFLFSETATPDLDSAQITNEALLDAFRNLCFTEDSTGRGGSVRRAVDFGNLGSEELGSIYESLLELHPEIDSQDGPFVLRTAPGNERKTSGSYYTPTSLINCLLDSALDPVVNQAIDVPDRDEAKRRLLNLKVCDPACGSGHFLIAAANRMALHLARLETQDTEPTTLQIQHAKRQIIGHCIYGVDINEMAVELCKVSLWMEALEPGKPLSFLENHIKCGNSLFGATPRLLSDGIPDDAFNPVEGDDKEICIQLKKQNKRERIDHKSGQRSLFEPFYKLGNMADRFAKLSAAGDDSLDAIADKQKTYEELMKGTPYLNARFWADTWCAVFWWKKNDTDLGRLCPTEYKFREIERNPRAASPLLLSEVKKFAEDNQFFHWHLAFPEVFAHEPNDSEAESGQMGWTGGFDVVLGNPPWERIRMDEQEFFSSIRPDIADASTTKRRQLIKDLGIEMPELAAAWKSFRLAQEGASFFIRQSGRFRLTGKGKFNTANLFAETFTGICKSSGRSGLIIPTGFVTDDAAKDLFDYLVRGRRLVYLFDFENREKLFPSVDTRYRFSLLVFQGSSRNEVGFIASFMRREAFGLSDEARLCNLRSDDIDLINPNSGTCPVVGDKRDLELMRLMYNKFRVLIRHTPYSNEWNAKPTYMFQMSDVGGVFLDLADAKLNPSPTGLTALHDSVVYVPLYEAKLVHQFDHRFATFASQSKADCKAGKARIVSQNDKDALNFTVTRFFVPESLFHAKMETRPAHSSWLIGYREITNATNERTLIASYIPRVAAGRKLPQLYLNQPALASACLVGWFNSFPFDFIARCKLTSTSVSNSFLEQMPFPSPAQFKESELGDIRHGSWVGGSVLELSFTSWDLKGLGMDCQYDGPPFAWNEQRRFQIRCELDAAYFYLYLGSKNAWGISKGKDKSESTNETLLDVFPTPRDAVSYIMDTFPIVRRKDEAMHGEYRTKRVILEIYDQMTEIIEANEAIRAANPGKSEEELRPLLRCYQSPLNPPPGPPTDANGNFIPYADWTDEIHRQYADVIHPPKRAIVEWSQVELLQDLLLVLEAWQKPASISAIEPALLLMRDDRARAILSGRDNSTSVLSANPKPIKLEGIETIYFALEANKTIEKVGATGYRLAKPELIAQVPASRKVMAREAVAIVNSFNNPEEASRAIAAQASFDFQVTTYAAIQS
jgi:hypothetical protein